MTTSSTITTIPNHYIATSSNGSGFVEYINIDGAASWGNSGVISGTLKAKTGIHPELYFKYIKSKFSTLEKIKLDNRLKKLEKAFYRAVDNGQEALGRKLMTEIARETRESILFVKGIKLFIERDDLVKHKHKIRGGHISDTLLKDFTRVIPDSVLKKKEKVKDIFDDFVIYHYWNEESARKAEKKERMSAEEKSKMRDPVLFGIIKESNRLYFIADWEDEFCDLSFDELVDVIGKDESELTISREPNLK